MARLSICVVLFVASVTPSAMAAEPTRWIPDPSFPAIAETVELGACAAVAVDSKQRIYLFHRGQQPIMQLDRQGRLLRAWGDGDIKAAHGLRIDAEDNLWVTDMNGHRVLKYNLEGELLLTLGTGEPGDGADQFNKPTDVAFGPNGEFFVSDGYGNSRVLRFAADGKLLGQWGRPGDQPGAFHLPHAIVIDRDGRVLVGDRENDRIQIFDQQGKLKTIWPGFAPYGLALDPQQRLFVADGRTNQVLQLNDQGKVVERIGTKGEKPGEFRMPHMLTFDAEGNLYVAEVQGKRLQKFLRR